MSRNAVKWDPRSIFYATCTKRASQIQLGIAMPFRVTDIIHKYDSDNIVNWGKLHMFSKQTCICLTFFTICKTSSIKIWFVTATNNENIFNSTFQRSRKPSSGTLINGPLPLTVKQLLYSC